jgi:hypothetical protein
MTAAGLARTSIFKRLECQTAFHVNSDPQRFSGVLANPLIGRLATGIATGSHGTCLTGMS